MQNQNLLLFKFLSSSSPAAIAKVSGGSKYPDISGEVLFYPFGSGVLVIADIEHIPETQTNFFAMHIHEGSSCDENFSSTGGHYNPKNSSHPNHAGDLPPLLSCEGCAWLAVYTNRVKIHEILGKTIVIHENYDDFSTQPAGNSGEKIACGEIVKT